jgi:hypothetical protein
VKGEAGCIFEKYMEPPITLLTQAEAAKILSCTIRTLASWRSRGIGPAFYRIAGSRIRYDPADLEAFIQESRVAPLREYSGESNAGATA